MFNLISMTLNFLHNYLRMRMYLLLAKNKHCLNLIVNCFQSAQRRIRAMVAQASAPGRRRAAQPPPAQQ